MRQEPRNRLAKWRPRHVHKIFALPAFSQGKPTVGSGCGMAKLAVRGALRTARRQEGIVMRKPSAPAWIRASIVAAALTAGLAAFVSGARAEDKLPRLFVFGDSYTDIALAGLWCVYPLPLQENLGIDQMVEFGVGGARASPFGLPAVVPPGWHLQQQVDAYLATGNLVSSRDLVTLNNGDNDGLALLSNIATPLNNTFIGYAGISISLGNASNTPDIPANCPVS
jgi:hypothetical protein